MSLIQLDIPSPTELRGGWAAIAAVLAAQGWDDVRATEDQWFFHDAGGNWTCLRFEEKGRAILIGHDHEYSDTYFGEAAEYFQEEETDLLSNVPDWWSFNIDPRPFGDWIGFVYGWDGTIWQRANYDKNDGFKSVGLLSACSVDSTEHLKEFSQEAPGLKAPPSEQALKTLINLDGHITRDALEAVVPGWDIDAGVEAGRRFLLNQSV